MYRARFTSLGLTSIFILFAACSNQSSFRSGDQSASSPNINGMGFGGIIRVLGVSQSTVLGQPGVQVNLIGENFVAVMGVAINGMACANVSVVTSDKASCGLSEPFESLTSVVITPPAGEEVAYFPPVPLAVPPTLSSISPTAGSIAGGTVLTINGMDFHANANVDIGGAACLSVTLVSPQKITCVVPPHVPGSINVSVVNSDSQFATALSAFTFVSQTANANTWASLSTTGAPSARVDHAVVWTGSKMIVWGGNNGSTDLGTGGLYDPTTNSWTPMTTASAPSPRSAMTSVWTGSKMIIFGGGLLDDVTYFNNGGMYDPNSDIWIATDTASAPAKRRWTTAVWTGSRMVLWGGNSTVGGGVRLYTGGVFNPQMNLWTAITTTGAPPQRDSHAAVWTGTEMLVWGGWGGGPLNSGGLYNPTTDNWTLISTTNAPAPRWNTSMVWAGNKAIVWGGGLLTSNVTYNTGGVYDLATNTWTAMTTTGAPSKRHACVSAWNGSKMLIWGGYDFTNRLGNGGLYDLATNTWSPISNTSAPSARSSYVPGGVWAGDRLLIWGGMGSSGVVGTGGTYFAY